MKLDPLGPQLENAFPQPSNFPLLVVWLLVVLSTLLAQVVGTNGKPLMAADLPDTPGLSAWQRSLLVILNSCEGAR
jgi:hypothetical protein